MMSFRSADGISEGEMYREKISNARSSKERSFHFDAHSSGRVGISSGMNRPPSEARPLRTTSSKESYAVLASNCGLVILSMRWVVSYIVGSSAGT
jgi:hypothetical protein